MASIDVTPAALVLVGGRSSRMGADKASLILDGTTLLQRTLDTLGAAGIDRVLVPGSEELPDPSTQPLGPLAGVVNGWNAICQSGEPADPVIVCAVDIPLLSPEVIVSLTDASLRSGHGAVAHDGDRLQPLIAAYRPSALDAAVAAFESGERSLRRLFERWDLAIVQHDPMLLADADRPEDLSGFQVTWPQPDEPRHEHRAD